MKIGSFDKFILAGAYARLCKDVLAKFYSYSGRVLPKNMVAPLRSAMNKIQTVTSNAEDRMYLIFPELNDEGKNVFYGAVGINRMSDIDRNVRKEMRRILEEYLSLIKEEEE